MESWESKHSDQSFSSKLAKELGVTAAPLRLDSQAKYGEGLVIVACLLCVHTQLLHDIRHGIRSHYLSTAVVTQKASGPLHEHASCQITQK